jgi:peroxiredoxin
MEAPIENLLVLAQGGRQHSPLSLSSLKGKAVVLHFFTS